MSEIFFKKKLSEILDLKYGKGLSKNKRLNGSFPVYGSGGIVGSHNLSLVKGPGIIIGRKGSIGTTYFEKNNFFPIDTVYYVKLLDAKKFDLKFVYYLLKNSNLKNLNSDAAVPGLNRNEALRQEFEIPTFDLQKKIAFVLWNYDELISKNSTTIKLLNECVFGIFREWFINFRFPGHKNTSMKLSNLGKIPEDWMIKKISVVANVSWGDTNVTKASYVSKGYPAYSAAGLDGMLSYFDYERDAIVLSAIGANCGNTWFASGRWSCIKNTIRFFATTNEISNEYMYYYTYGKKFWPKRGAAQPFISQTDIKKLSILIPSKKLLSEFSVIAKSNLKLIDILKNKNSILKKSRDLLIPKLIRGEISASKIDIKNAAA